MKAVVSTHLLAALTRPVNRLMRDVERVLEMTAARAPEPEAREESARDVLVPQETAVPGTTPLGVVRGVRVAKAEGAPLTAVPPSLEAPAPAPGQGVPASPGIEPVRAPAPSAMAARGPAPVRAPAPSAVPSPGPELSRTVAPSAVPSPAPETVRAAAPSALPEPVRTPAPSGVVPEPVQAPAPNVVLSPRPALTQAPAPSTGPEPVQAPAPGSRPRRAIRLVSRPESATEPGTQEEVRVTPPPAPASTSPTSVSAPRAPEPRLPYAPPPPSGPEGRAAAPETHVPAAPPRRGPGIPLVPLPRSVTRPMDAGAAERAELTRTGSLLPVPGFSSGPEEAPGLSASIPNGAMLLPVPGFSSGPEGAPDIPVSIPDGARLLPVPGFSSGPEEPPRPGRDTPRPDSQAPEPLQTRREAPTEVDDLAERERFSDTLVEVLRAAARREGVEV